MSIPLESVPRKFSADGGMSRGNAAHSVGSWGEKNE
jgi:hypothetical protein